MTCVNPAAQKVYKKIFEKKESSNVVEDVDDVNDIGNDDDTSGDIAGMTCDSEPCGIEGFPEFQVTVPRSFWGPSGLCIS